MDADILGNFILRLVKLLIVLGFLCAFAAGIERILGLDTESDIDSFQQAAKAGNALPLALVYVGAMYLVSVIFSRFQ